MAESSRRAARHARKGGLRNAVFVVAAAEAPLPELAGVAQLLTVRFPWGSLLRGVVARDDAVAAGIAALAAQASAIELLLAPSPRDGLADVPTSTESLADAVRRTFEPFGFMLADGRLASSAEIHESGSTWARRLGVGSRRVAVSGGSGVEDRSVTFIRLSRPGHR